MVRSFGRPAGGLSDSRESDVCRVAVKARPCGPIPRPRVCKDADPGPREHIVKLKLRLIRLGMAAAMLAALIEALGASCKW